MRQTCAWAVGASKQPQADGTEGFPLSNSCTTLGEREEIVIWRLCNTPKYEIIIGVLPADIPTFHHLGLTSTSEVNPSYPTSPVSVGSSDSGKTPFGPRYRY